MKKKDNWIRTPRHLRTGDLDIDTQQSNSVGEILLAAERKLLVKRIVCVGVILLLSAGILFFIFSDWFDILLQRLIREIG